MSVTLLEFVVGGVLVVVAWQLGVAIAPWIFQKLRSLKQDLDEVAEEIEPNQTEHDSPQATNGVRSNNGHREKRE